MVWRTLAKNCTLQLTIYRNPTDHVERILTISATVVMNSRSQKEEGFPKRDKKQTMIDLRGIPTNWFKKQLCLSGRLSRLRALQLDKFYMVWLYRSLRGEGSAPCDTDTASMYAKSQIH
jgi:hypothetical protein